MSEMVMRVAEALSKLPVRDVAQPGSELDQLRLREAARAAIEAMRVSLLARLVTRFTALAGKTPIRDCREAIDEVLKDDA